jgi:hypothetical protein
MNPSQTPSRGVILRDLLIFLAKFGLDSLKDVVLFQVAIGAAAVDIVLGRHKQTVLLYKVLEAAERLDLWLNLYGAVGAGQDRDGLFGRSRAGSNNLLGRLEQLVRNGDVPRSVRGRAA